MTELQEAIAKVNLAKQSGAMDGTTAKAWEIIEEAVASGALVPASDVQLATALVVQKAGEKADKHYWEDEPGSAESAILALAPTDALAELNALRAERDAIAQKFDELHPDPALMARIIMASIENEVRAEAAEAEVVRLRKWAALGMAVMEGWLEGGDLDGFQLQEMAEKAGVLYPVPGGFDPAVHTDQYGAAETGDDWFMIIPRAALHPTTQAQAEEG